MEKRSAHRAKDVLSISLLGAAVSTFFYARARRRKQQSDTGLASGPSDLSIRRLLQAYEATRSVVETFPRKRSINVLDLFVSRSYLKTATVHHIKQVLSLIHAHYYARAALGKEPDERDRKAVEDYLFSLPDLSIRRFVVMTALVGVALAVVLSLVLEVVVGIWPQSLCLYRIT
jgi:hypothetical protein